VHGAPFNELGDIAINPIYEADVIKRLEGNQLRSVFFYYTANAKMKKPTICLFVLMLGIPLWSKRLRKSLSFIEYFIEILDHTSFGSIDLRKSESYERERLERRFILESIAEVRKHLDKADRPLHDYSNDYIM